MTRREPEQLDEAAGPCPLCNRPPAPSTTRFRDLHPAARVAAVVMLAAIAVVLVAVLALAGRWAVHLFLAVWRAA